MNDNDKIADEMDNLLRNFQNVLHLMNTNVQVEDKNLEIKAFAEKIVENSKMIDKILNESELFSQNDQELDQKLKDLDAQNQLSQKKFEMAKNKLESIKMKIKDSLVEISSLKFTNSGFPSRELQPNLNGSPQDDINLDQDISFQ